MNATCEDSTPETPNLEDYKSPPDREQEHHNEELEAHGKRSSWKKKLTQIEYMKPISIHNRYLT